MSWKTFAIQWVKSITETNCHTEQRLKSFKIKRIVSFSDKEIGIKLYIRNEQKKKTRNLKKK